MNCVFGMSGVGIFGLVASLVSAVVGLAMFVFWLWMLIHAITNKGLDGTEKIVWVLVVILLPFLGSLIYFFLGRPKAGG